MAKWEEKPPPIVKAKLANIGGARARQTPRAEKRGSDGNQTL